MRNPLDLPSVALAFARICTARATVTVWHDQTLNLGPSPTVRNLSNAPQSISPAARSWRWSERRSLLFLTLSVSYVARRIIALLEWAGPAAPPVFGGV